MLPSPACSFDDGFHHRRVDGLVLADSVSQARKSPGLTRSALVQSHLPKQLSRRDASLNPMQSSLCILNSLSSLATFPVIACMSFCRSFGLPPLWISSVTSVLDGRDFNSFYSTVMSSLSSSEKDFSFEWSTLASMNSLNSFFSSFNLLNWVNIFAKCSLTWTMF